MADVHEVLEATDKSKFLRLIKHARTCR